MKLYVGNLPYNISDDQLRDMFAKFGVPDSARVITDRDSGQSKGFGFVEFSVSLIAPAITSGNTCIALASTAQPYPAIVLGEMLATSDLPGGVVNLLTGFRKEMVPTFATHTHLRAIAGVANAEERKALKLGAADSVKRVKLTKAEEPVDWFSEKAQSLYDLRDTLEFKTTWHPIGA